MALFWLLHSIRDGRTDAGKDQELTRNHHELAEFNRQLAERRAALNRAKEHLKAGEPIYSYPVHIPAHTYQIGLAALIASLVALQEIATELEAPAARNAADAADSTRISDLKQQLARTLMRVRDILRCEQPHVGGEKMRDEWLAIYVDVGALCGRVEFCFCLFSMQDHPSKRRLAGTSQG